MTDQEYEAAKTSLGAGQIVHLRGRSASNVDELDFIKRAEENETKAQDVPDTLKPMVAAFSGISASPEVARLAAEVQEIRAEVASLRSDYQNGAVYPKMSAAQSAASSLPVDEIAGKSQAFTPEMVAENTPDDYKVTPNAPDAANDTADADNGGMDDNGDGTIDEIESLSLNELKDKAASLGLTGVSQFNKAEYQSAIRAKLAEG